jgi:hypothetical protein
MSIPPWFRFLACVPLGGMAIWGGLAVWIGLAPLSVLDAGQVVSIVKDDLIRQCEATTVVIFGDSRADESIEPRRLPVPALNLSLGGGSPMVDFYRLRRLLTCPHKPGLVILSYSLPELVRLTDWAFWANSVSTHMLTFSERREILKAIDMANAKGFVQAVPGDAAIDFSYIPGAARNLLYQIYFPPFYGANALKSLKDGVAIRMRENTRIREAIFRDHGEPEFGEHPKEYGGVGHDAELTIDAANPAIDLYLNQILELLAERRIPSIFAVMPVNNATYNAMPAAVREHLMRYLGTLTARYPHSGVVDQVLPHWPDRYFFDHNMHPTEAGRAAVSAILAACIGDQIAEREPDPARLCSLQVPKR